MFTHCKPQIVYCIQKDLMALFWQVDGHADSGWHCFKLGLNRSKYADIWLNDGNKWLRNLAGRCWHVTEQCWHVADICCYVAERCWHVAERCWHVANKMLTSVWNNMLTCSWNLQTVAAIVWKLAENADMWLKHADNGWHCLESGRKMQTFCWKMLTWGWKILKCGSYQ